MIFFVPSSTAQRHPCPISGGAACLAALILAASTAAVLPARPCVGQESPSPSPSPSPTFQQLTEPGIKAGREEAKRINIPFRLKTGAYFFGERDDVRGRFGSGTWLIEPEIEFSGGAVPRNGFFNRLRFASLLQVDEDRDTNIQAFTVSQVHSEKRTQSRVQGYLGYGLGLYQVKVDTPETDRKRRSLFGGFLVAGADVDDFIFEVKYHLISRYRSEVNGVTSDVNVNNLQIMVGIDVSRIRLLPRTKEKTPKNPEPVKKK